MPFTATALALFVTRIRGVLHLRGPARERDVVPHVRFPVRCHRAGIKEWAPWQIHLGHRAALATLRVIELRKGHVSFKRMPLLALEVV